MTPGERRLNGRIGGLVVRSRHDPLEYTAKARSTFAASFLEQVPSDLPPAERQARAEALRRAHYARLAAASARARAARKRGGPEASRDR